MINDLTTPIITHAFIDAQNVKMATAAQGWDYDLFRLRRYLSDKYGVTHAYFFVGYLSSNEGFYEVVEQAGYIIRYKEVAQIAGQKPKGNVDVDLVLQASVTINDYDYAVLVSADGDFAPLVRLWKEREKFRAVLSPATAKKTSHFLRRDANPAMDFMPIARNVLEKKKRPRKD